MRPPSKYPSALSHTSTRAAADALVGAAGARSARGEQSAPMSSVEHLAAVVRGNDDDVGAIRTLFRREALQFFPANLDDEVVR